MLTFLAGVFACALAAPGGVIAFTAGADPETRCACVLDLASGAIIRVGPGANDGAPQWSPDGEWLAFTARMNDGMGVYVVRADGKEGRFLQHAHAWNLAPAWSPDGRRLAYPATADMNLARKLCVWDMAADAETVWAAGREGILSTVWMPNLDLMRALDPSEQIVMEGLDTARFLEEGADEGVVAAVGLVGEPGRLSTELLLVTRGQTAPLLKLLLPEGKEYAEWAPRPDPDGERFAFESNEGGDREVFVLGRRGIGDVSNHRSADWNPVWSPEGNFLAFESFRGGRRGVYGVYPETARVFPIAAAPDYDCWSPAWSPDEAWVACVSNRDGAPRLYVFRRDGSEAVRATNTDEEAFAPAWRPEVKK